MSAYGFGDIALVPFPFTDQSGAKKRPAVVVSGTAYNEARRDVVIMAVTSQIRSSGTFGEVMIEDWQAASLLTWAGVRNEHRRRRGVSCQHNRSTFLSSTSVDGACWHPDRRRAPGVVAAAPGPSTNR